MLSLAMYSKLNQQDITKNRTIAGTGTIDEYGNVTYKEPTLGW